MDRLAKVLVAVDFSPCSGVALREAARIASWSRASLSAVHAVDPGLFTPIPPDTMLPLGLLVEEARGMWEKFVPDCAARRGTPITIEVGRSRDVIIERVRVEKPDLLVIGAHSDLDAHRAIGGTAAACVQHAATKVLVVRESQAGAFRSVVACVDFTETSRTALEQAIRVAARDGAALHVLHVFTDPRRGKQSAADAEALRAAQQRAMLEQLRKFCEPMAHEIGALRGEFHATLSVSHGEGIIAFAREHGCDLVALGTRAAWNLRDFMWGSTAERVVRECPCSVLTVKPAGFGEGG